MTPSEAVIFNMQNSNLTQCHFGLVEHGLRTALDNLTISLIPAPAVGVIENSLIICGYYQSNKEGMSLHDNDYANCLVYQPSKQNYFTPALKKIPMMREYHYPISVLLNATTMWVIGNSPGTAGSSDLITLEKGSVVLISHFSRNEV